MDYSNLQLMVASFLQKGSLMGYHDILCWFEPFEEGRTSRAALELAFGAAKIEHVEEAMWPMHVEGLAQSRLREAGIQGFWTIKHDYPAGDRERIEKMKLSKQVVQSRAEAFLGASLPWSRRLAVAPCVSDAAANHLLACLERIRISKGIDMAMGASSMRSI